MSSSEWREPRASSSIARAIEVAGREIHLAEAARCSPGRRRPGETARTPRSSRCRRSVRRLVMMLRIVALTSPCCCSSSLHHGLDRRARARPDAGRARPAPGPRCGSWPRSRCASWTAKASGRRRGRWRPRQPAARSAASSAAIQQPVGQLVRRLPRAASLSTIDLGEPPQVLDQHDPQRDRHRPQLADGERLHRLVGEQVAAQRLGIEMAVGVGDQRPGRAEDARQAGERPFGQLRQLRSSSPAAGRCRSRGSACRPGGSCRSAIPRPA